MPLEYDPIARGIIEPLALVDWFTSFQALDQTTGMYIVSHSTRQHRRYTSVICVTDILRTVHLIPYAGKHIDRTWTSTNVLDRCTRFLVNPYLRHHDFVLFRYLIDHFH